MYMMLNVGQYQPGCFSFFTVTVSYGAGCLLVRHLQKKNGQARLNLPTQSRVFSFWIGLVRAPHGNV